MRGTAVGALDEIEVRRIHRRVAHAHADLVPFRWRKLALFEFKNFGRVAGAVELKKLGHGAWAREQGLISVTPRFRWHLKEAF
jgi:hypothetical protein